MKDFKILEEKIRDLLPKAKVNVGKTTDGTLVIDVLIDDERWLTAKYIDPNVWTYYGTDKAAIYYNDWQKVLQQILIVMEKS